MGCRCGCRASAGCREGLGRPAWSGRGSCGRADARTARVGQMRRNDKPARSPGRRGRRSVKKVPCQRRSACHQLAQRLTVWLNPLDTDMQPVFEALASPVRRKILAYLAHAELNAGDIASRFAMSQAVHLPAFVDPGGGGPGAGREARAVRVLQPGAGQPGEHLGRLHAGGLPGQPPAQARKRRPGAAGQAGRKLRLVAGACLPVWRRGVVRVAQQDRAQDS